MNIFILDEDPILAARMMCDKHVVKMVLESTQILSTVAHSKGFKTYYKPTHRHHPCTLWAAKSIQNWTWLLDHSLALCDEYTLRYNRVHKCYSVLIQLKILDINLPDIGVTDFVLAMPDCYKSSNPVDSYRAYYLGSKRKFAKWKHSAAPQWWKDNIENG